MSVEWGGKQWHPTDLPPSAANTVALLASSVREDQLSATVDVLAQAGVSVESVIECVTDADDDFDILDLVASVLAVGTARPWRSTVGLCRSTVTQWSTIRGRLIDKGIPDPLRSLPSLTALLDVVEIMILDSMEKKEDREKFLRELYRAGDAGAPPPGWSDGANLDGLF